MQSVTFTTENLAVLNVTSPTVVVVLAPTTMTNTEMTSTVMTIEGKD